ncbi:uncharacterized protein EV422DRAFT_511021 [Fimicolochytrium jonesii]|uniref:uncharacterized protein n=1 Tax=Fimicolochytrium jonesii TaxID=1396493 RepID=UPI0022FE21B8|nr:uncharacterized protein EV422DRAFT_511021 [Fimicolochytrium jonesii]KAI8826667.1 hypothetical protein EV422DRAFT_511021 [Fimicolochytrium jonesii]
MDGKATSTISRRTTVSEDDDPPVATLKTEHDSPKPTAASEPPSHRTEPSMPTTVHTPSSRPLSTPSPAVQHTIFVTVTNIGGASSAIRTVATVVLVDPTSSSTLTSATSVTSTSTSTPSTSTSPFTNAILVDKPPFVKTPAGITSIFMLSTVVFMGCILLLKLALTRQDKVVPKHRQPRPPSLTWAMGSGYGDEVEMIRLQGVSPGRSDDTLVGGRSPLMEMPLPAPYSGALISTRHTTHNGPTAPLSRIPSHRSGRVPPPFRIPSNVSLPGEGRPALPTRRTTHDSYAAPLPRIPSHRSGRLPPPFRIPSNVSLPGERRPALPTRRTTHDSHAAPLPRIPSHRSGRVPPPYVSLPGEGRHESSHFDQSVSHKAQLHR